MPAIIRIENLTKSTARTAASSTSTSRSRPARSSASSGPTAPARRRRSARCSTSSARRRAARSCSTSRSTVDPVSIHRRIGYIPGEFALYDRLTGGQTIEYFANLRGGVDKAYQAALIERFDLDPSRKFKEYSKGNKQKVGLVIALQHRPELLILDEPTSGLDPLVQQTFYDARPRGAGARAGRSSCRATSCPRSSGPATASRSSATAGWSRSTASRRCATSPTTRWSCASRTASRRRRSPGCPGVSRRHGRGPHAAHARRRARSRRSSGRRRSYELLDFVSREPTLEETFLAQYGRRGAGGDARHDRARRQPRPAARTAPPTSTFSRIYGLGSVYAQDAPRLAARVDHRRRACSAACSSSSGGAPFAEAYPTPESRAELGDARRPACRRSWPACTATRSRSPSRPSAARSPGRRRARSGSSRPVVGPRAVRRRSPARPAAAASSSSPRRRSACAGSRSRSWPRT